MATFAVNLSDLRSQVSTSFYRRGVDYQSQGRVLSCSSHRRGLLETVTGRVRGSGDHVYTVHVELERDTDGSLLFDGDCSCPVGYNCKHVVAVLIEKGERGSHTRPKPHGATPQATPNNGIPIDTWASQLALVSETFDDHVTGAESRERLLYILGWDPHTHGAPRLTVVAVTCRVLQHGGYGKSTKFNIARAREPFPPQLLCPADIEILRLLDPVNGNLEMAPALSGERGSHLLDRLLRSGRCHWRDKDTPALTLGEPRTASIEWRLCDDGCQRIGFITEHGESETLPLSPPWYLDTHSGACGELRTGLSAALAGAVAGAPAVSPEQAQRLPASLAQLLAQFDLPTPRKIIVEDLNEPPTPCLRLLKGGARNRPNRFEHWYAFATTRPPRARLSFDYAGIAIDYGRDTATPLVRRGERLLRLQRNIEVESECLGDLANCGLAPLLTLAIERLPVDEDPLEMAFDPNSPENDEVEAWLEFLRVEVPRLRAQGWRIEIDPDFDHRLASAEDWYAEVEEEEGNNWFDVDLGVLIDGQRLPLLPLLHHWLSERKTLESIEAMSDDQELLTQTPDGCWLYIPVRRVRTIVRALLELCDPDLRLTHGKLRLSVWRAADVEQLADNPEQDAAAAWRWRGGERLRRLATKMRAFDGIQPLAAPAGFGAELRPYQRHGLGWLQFLREFGLGGILADDMGLGKTVQALAHLLIELRAGRLDRPSLIVAPTSLLTNWAAEARRFAPQLDLLVLHGPERKALFAAIDRHTVVLTTYGLAHRDREVHAAHRYHLLILDEAQAIKNPRSKVAQALRGFDARLRLCLTGTPLENHLGELWSLFDFLEPGLLGTQRQFRRLFRTPIEKHGDIGRQSIMQQRVTPFVLRRSKDKVLSELPPKTEIERLVELEPAQRDLYEAIRLAMHQKIQLTIAKQGMERSQIVILDALLKLRQVCCDPRLVKLAAASRVRGSAKLTLLMELLPEMLAEGRRVLLFSQFTSMLALIEEGLRTVRIDYVKLTGATRDRDSPIQRFQDGEVPLFLISLKAGGVGLNLTAADTVIHYDPWWNPAVQNQATDRAHRIGQDKKVFVYKLITAGTVEQKIVAMQARKRNLADTIYAAAPTGGGSQLSGEDLEQLLAPLA